MSAPRLPTNATSAPSTAIQAAMFAPEPPPCMVTVAGVSLPLTSGNAAWATACGMMSPTTPTRVIVTHSSRARTAILSGGGSGGPPAGHTAGECDSSDSVEKPNSFRSSWQREHSARYHKNGFLGFRGEQLVEAAQLVAESAAAFRGGAGPPPPPFPPPARRPPGGPPPPRPFVQPVPQPS